MRTISNLETNKVTSEKVSFLNRRIKVQGYHKAISDAKMESKEYEALT